MPPADHFGNIKPVMTPIVEKYEKPSVEWFTQARFGMFIHWGLYALAARHEWVKSREELKDEHYERYFDHFYPDLYDPRDWARRAREAGMKYVIITTKHHEGFCLWDSAHTDYKATATPWGKDLIEPFVDAFRDAGLRIGFYYSLLDWHHPDYTVDRRHPQRDDKKARAADEGKDIRVYAEYMRNQVTELLSRFHPDIMWYDFSFPGEDGKGREHWESEKLYALTREMCPETLINNRLDLPGSADFITPEQFQPKKQPRDEEGNLVVWEACQTFSGSWGYYRDEYSWKSVEQLLQMLIDGVSKNGNLLLNVGPTARGAFDSRACARLSEMGQWMGFNGRSIYGCSAAPEEWEVPPDCRYTYNPSLNCLYVHVFAWPFKHLHLPGMKARVRYAQFLHDGSEVQQLERQRKSNTSISSEDDAHVLVLPTRKPDVAIPVIELFLK